MTRAVRFQLPFTIVKDNILMSDYDFSSLNDKEFEELSADLL